MRVPLFLSADSIVVCMIKYRSSGISPLAGSWLKSVPSWLLALRLAFTPWSATPHCHLALIAPPIVQLASLQYFLKNDASLLSANVATVIFKFETEPPTNIETLRIITL